MTLYCIQIKVNIYVVFKCIQFSIVMTIGFKFSQYMRNEVLDVPFTTLPKEHAIRSGSVCICAVCSCSHTVPFAYTIFEI